MDSLNVDSGMTDMSSKHYDFVVVGGGGGMKLVRPVADLGFKVALVERERLGGTCLNRGCIPSKMLIHPADLACQSRNLQSFNFKESFNPEIHFDSLIEYVNQTVNKESDQLRERVKEHPNVDLYSNSAHFVSDKCLAVGSHKIWGDKVIISVGAEAHKPSIEGLASTPYWQYRGALKAPKLPNKLLIIGGGYIAVELGHFLGSLGTEVTFVLRSTFLRQEDKTIQEAFHQSFSSQHTVYTNTQINQVSYDDKEGFALDVQGNKTLYADQLLVATGIEPCTQSLGIENTAITLDDKGFIIVDDYLQTQQEGVYAIGDVLGKDLFRHVVNYQGEYLFDHLVTKTCQRPIQYPSIPHAVFTHPQIASVGFTEEELKQKNIPYVAAENPYQASAMGMALRSTEGLVKLLFDKSTQCLIGAHIIGAEASNLIHMPIAFMKMEATLEDMLDTIYIHPALPELIRNTVRRAKACFEQKDEL